MKPKLKISKSPASGKRILTNISVPANLRISLIRRSTLRTWCTLTTLPTKPARIRTASPISEGYRWKTRCSTPPTKRRTRPPSPGTARCSSSARSPARWAKPSPASSKILCRYKYKKRNCLSRWQNPKESRGSAIGKEEWELIFSPSPGRFRESSLCSWDSKITLKIKS